MSSFLSITPTPLAYVKLGGVPHEEAPQKDVAPSAPSHEESIALKLLTTLPPAITWMGLRFAAHFVRFQSVPFEVTMEALLRGDYRVQLEKACQDPDWSKKNIHATFQQAFNLREVILSIGRELVLWPFATLYAFPRMLEAESPWALPYLNTPQEQHSFIVKSGIAMFAFGVGTGILFGFKNAHILQHLLYPGNPTPLSVVARRAFLKAIEDVRDRVNAGQMQCQPGVLDRLEDTIKSPSQKRSGISVAFEPKVVGAVGGAVAGVALLRQMAIRGMTSPNPFARASGFAAAAALYLFTSESLRLEDMIPLSAKYDDGGA